MSTSTLPTTKIGKDTTTGIGYGAMGFGGAFYGAMDGSDEDRFKILDRLYELGERNIDTASVYGDSEEMLGKWFKKTGHRKEFFIATKFGFDAEYKIRGDPQFVREEFEKSIKKLDMEYVDLYYQHRPDPKVPIEVTVRAMAELVKEGRVKYLGLSEASPATIRRAHKVHPIAAVQVEYSPFELSPELPGGILETCKELGIAVVAYSPTGRGLLTGRFTGPEDFNEGDFRRNHPKFSKENYPHILKLAEGLKEIGTAHNASAAQVAIAWLVAQGTIPIPGSKQIKYIEENLAAAHLKLNEGDLKKIRELVDESEKSITGDRYPPGFMEQVLVDTPPLDSAN